jgi:hypothetical protein
MCGRITGNPSDDILNEQGVEVPSLEVCRSFEKKESKKCKQLRNEQFSVKST